MDPRPTDNKTKKLLVEGVEIGKLMEYLNSHSMPVGDAAKHTKMKKEVTALFNKNHDAQQIIRPVGNNNLVFILNHTHFVILLSETRPTAADVSTVFPDSSWVPTDYLLESIKGTQNYQNKEKSFRKENDPRFNHYEENKTSGEFLSVSVTEHIANSLVDLVKLPESEEEAKIKPTLSDDQRIDLACDMYQQISTVFSDLGKRQYLWTDLKPGNIMVRDDGSIAIPDKKAFMSHQDVLVKGMFPPGYQFRSVENKEMIGQENKKNPGEMSDNRFYFTTPKDTTSPFEFSVKHKNGEIVKGEISNENLRKKFVNEDEYNLFRNYLLNNAFVTSDSAISKIYEAASEEHGTLPISYTTNCHHYTTPGYASEAFKEQKFYAAPGLARAGYIDDVHSEYSFQLAAILYVSLTGSEKKFTDLMDRKPLDFNLPVFETPEGGKLKDLIIKLSDPDPKNRLSYKEGLREINKLRQPIERAKIARAIPAEPERKRPTLKEYGRRMTSGAIVGVGAPKIKSSDSESKEKAKRQQQEVRFQKMEAEAGIKTGKPLKDKETIAKKSTITSVFRK